MAAPVDIKAFVPQPGDPLYEAHRTLVRWIAAALVFRDRPRKWTDVDLKSLESGQLILNSSSDDARRLVAAAVVQDRYWEEPAQDKTFQTLSAPWQIWQMRRHIVSALTTLLRRPVPLEKAEVLALLEWPAAAELNAASSIVKVAVQYVEAHGKDSDFEKAAGLFARALINSPEASLNRLGRKVEELCCRREANATDGVTAAPPPHRAPAGNPDVLLSLKRLYGIAAQDDKIPVTPIGPDRFPIPECSTFHEEHERVTALMEQFTFSPTSRSEIQQPVDERQAILALDDMARGRIFVAALERVNQACRFPSSETGSFYIHIPLLRVLRFLQAARFVFDRQGLFDVLLYLTSWPEWLEHPNISSAASVDSIRTVLENGASLTEGERFVLYHFRNARIECPPLGTVNPQIMQLTDLLGDNARFFLKPGEYWADAVNADLAALSGTEREKWTSLLRHTLDATTPTPTKRWRETAMPLLSAVDGPGLRQRLERWLPLVFNGRVLPALPPLVGETKRPSDLIHEKNATALRGLLWLMPLMTQREGLSRLLAMVALGAYKKVPGVGPREVKLGNAALYALSEMMSSEAIGQLAILKVRVSFGTAQKAIEKAFGKAAKDWDLPRDQIEEMSVPTCGLETVGRREELLGTCKAVLSVTQSVASLSWFDGSGKQLKSPPAAAKRDHVETVKDLQQGLKELGSMISAQRERIESLFLERKSWPAPAWRERYIDHPLVGTIARRLIWCIGATAVTIGDGSATDRHGKPVAIPDDALVTLWHPIGCGVDEVLDWRKRIESLGMVQPFKQAHREIYLLTDAELRTATYSNRFAAHILRQHQFNALCGARRWKNQLRMMVDDAYPPAVRELAAWGLRAEFLIEGIGIEHGSTMNGSSAFRHLATDQVRFYRAGAALRYAQAGSGVYVARGAKPEGESNDEPIPLDQVPELVFSEIMRDVDLFVGVASVGNDPAWQDGGPDGHHRDYWQEYSSGALSGSAVSRREVLERLVPRLKIAARCSLTERFLVVRGEKATYKIHLGSASIFIEPAGRYLCIVPGSRDRTNANEVYLPFEGDMTLSIILSKAILLAEDWKIKDSHIASQISGF